MANVFVLNQPDYKRDISIVPTYCRDTATYISKMTGQPYEECLAFVQKRIDVNGENPVYDAPVRYLARQKNGDRQQMTGTFLGYIQNTLVNEHIMSPTLTLYANIHRERSILGEYIKNNVALRKKDKKAMFKAEQSGDEQMEKFYGTMQETRKIKNNSLSGAHNSQGTVLFNKSSHSTLTSVCRSLASIGNANNEKFLAGNRHYWSFDITIANIISIVNRTDYVQLRAAMETFQIHYPTAEEAAACIFYSTNLYWRHQVKEEKIYQLMLALEPDERAAVVYSGDMFHLAKYNDALVRGFLGKISTPAADPIDNPEVIISKLSPDMITFSSLLCSDIMVGRGLSDVLKEDPRGYAMVAATAQRISDVVDEYAVMIRGLWVTRNMPASVANLPNSIRRVVIVSDTDSTIFTNQYWTEWYVGKLDWSETSNRIAYATTFLASQMVIHLLAMLSANIGIDNSQIHQLTMKNEYFYPVFTTTSMAKHYYAFMSAREGNVYAKLKQEIKGKNLRDSTLPAYINEGIREYTKMLMEKAMLYGKLDIDTVLRPVYDHEKRIILNAQMGGFEDMSSIMVKESAAYTDPTISAYQHYDIWNKVFAPKYGEIPPPPYRAIKVTVGIDNPTRFNRWLLSLEDKELAQRFRDWMIDNRKNCMGSMLLLPLTVLEQMGIPPEITPIIQIRKLVFETLKPYYMILESLGINIVDKGYTKLVCDVYNPDAITAAL